METNVWEESPASISRAEVCPLHIKLICSISNYVKDTNTFNGKFKTYSPFILTPILTLFSHKGLEELPILAEAKFPHNEYYGDYL